METVIKKYLYPPNFVGTYDATDPGGHRRYKVACTYSCDTRAPATTEGIDDYILAKRTDLRTVDGKIPGRLIIDRIWWHCTGIGIAIGYNNMNDEEAALITPYYSGTGEKDYRAIGGFVPEKDALEGEDDYGGDIVVSTLAYMGTISTTDSFDIVVDFRTHK